MSLNLTSADLHRHVLLLLKLLGGSCGCGSSFLTASKELVCERLLGGLGVVVGSQHGDGDVLMAVGHGARSWETKVANELWAIIKGFFSILST